MDYHIRKFRVTEVSKEVNQMVAKNIKQYLQDQGIMQTWLADKVDLSPSRLSQILNGKAPLGADMLFRICSVLGVSSDTFTPDKSA